MTQKNTNLSSLKNDFTPVLMDSYTSLTLRELSRLGRTLMFNLPNALHNKCKGTWHEPYTVAIPFSV